MEMQVRVISKDQPKATTLVNGRIFRLFGQELEVEYPDGLVLNAPLQSVGDAIRDNHSRRHAPAGELFAAPGQAQPATPAASAPAATQAQGAPTEKYLDYNQMGIALSRYLGLSENISSYTVRERIIGMRDMDPDAVPLHYKETPRGSRRYPVEAIPQLAKDAQPNLPTGGAVWREHRSGPQAASKSPEVQAQASAPDPEPSYSQKFKVNIHSSFKNAGIELSRGWDTRPMGLCGISVLLAKELGKPKGISRGAIRTRMDQVEAATAKDERPIKSFPGTPGQRLWSVDDVQRSLKMMVDQALKVLAGQMERGRSLAQKHNGHRNQPAGAA